MSMDNECLRASDKGQNLLGESNNYAARQGQEAVGTLGRVVALEGEAHLNDAPAQQNEAHGPDQAEDERGQVVDNGEGVAASGGGGKGRHGAAAHQGHGRHQGAVPAVALLHLVGRGQSVPVLLENVHCVLPP